eukprot:CAMPEP_0172508878 /NCGR_PEP_ID=MMETSP1066-20121228/215663_1 /TAXON_ID=671091 /ORGANISM="Coscinodiscus wailesii, Strain CCMP2513" /LENGTH=46 /DNA_ID= /DNA_START= /DNA_END= /DNA_ORIENTATION=
MDTTESVQVQELDDFEIDWDLVAGARTILEIKGATTDTEIDIPSLR